MTAAPNLSPVPTDCMAAVRALNQMRRAGFVLELDGPALVVSPSDRLNDEQRDYIRAHKPALVNLLLDAETLYKVLQAAGNAGIGWHEGTPPEWTDTRLLAADEVLYGYGRMVNRNGRRYLREIAPEPEADSLPGENSP